MNNLDGIRTQVIEAVAYEVGLELMTELLDNLTAKLHISNYFVSQELPRKHINEYAIGQLEHYAVQQVTDDVFSKTNIPYNLKETDSTGAFYPLIELQGIALLPRRSVNREAWRRAKYMRELAKPNKNFQTTGQQLDLLTPITPPTISDEQSNPITDKILVIMDICFTDTLYVKLIVPSSDFKHIHIAISLKDLVSGMEKLSDKNEEDLTVSPVARLKKSLSELDKRIQNE